MKEIYKIPKGQNIATSEGWKHIDTEIKNFVYETEQVPETFENLKELCIATNYIQDILKKNREEKSIPVHLNDCGTGYVIIKDLYFGENGIVFYEVKEQRYIIAKDLTFAQMWGIIKNLIGEE